MSSNEAYLKLVGSVREKLKDRTRKLHPSCEFARVTNVRSASLTITLRDARSFGPSCRTTFKRGIAHLIDYKPYIERCLRQNELRVIQFDKTGKQLADSHDSGPNILDERIRLAEKFSIADMEMMMYEANQISSS